MKIPAKYQIFATPVVLTDKDADRLSPHLTSWPRLNEMFLLDVFNEPDLRRLAILELMDRKRWVILSRLLMRLGRAERNRIVEKAKKLCR